MILLVDTSVWIGFFAGRDTPQTRFFKGAVREDADVALTGVILTEILQGVPSDSGFARLRKDLSSFRMLHPAPEDTYVRADIRMRSAEYGFGGVMNMSTNGSC